MIRNSLQEFFTHPLFISFGLSLALILSIPPFFSRFRVNEVKEEALFFKIRYVYADLDSDNQSERITFDLNDSEQTKILFTRNGKVLDQFDLRYHTLPYNFFFIDDYNNDGFKECFILTYCQDSLFLNVIDPVGRRKIIISNRFVDIWTKAAQSDDIPAFIKIGMTEGIHGKVKDFIFCINAGFSKQPRNAYKYIVETDSLVKSPRSSVVIFDGIISEVSNSQGPELILSTTATGNFEEDSPYSDQFSWLMVLDNNLEFLFPPVKICENPSSVFVVPMKMDNRSYMAILIDYFGSENIKSVFNVSDPAGNILIEKKSEEFEHTYARLFQNPGNNLRTFFCIKNRNAEVVELDTGLKVVNEFTIPPLVITDPNIKLDADLDGSKEYIFIGQDQRSLVIVQEDFRHPVEFNYDKVLSPAYISQVLTPGTEPQIFVQSGDSGLYLRFGKNPFYYLKYPFYVGIYFVLFLFITLIFRIQQYRMNQKLETERRIASLQMKAIKNQIDPHFTLNLLNAIGSLYATEENREKADYVFGKYAKMIRQTVISSDKIIVTLAEELEFVRNYLDLEKFRSNDSFQYIIEADPEADMQIKVPRMLIHTFAENAIKYGVRKRNNSGLLQIHIRKNEKACEITVEDNGPGLVTDELPGESTGKGLVIVKELADLYYRIEKSKISFSLENIPGSGTRSLGTKATIELFFRNPNLS